MDRDKVNIEDMNDQRAIEMHLDTIMKHKPIFSNNKYSIYDNGLVGKKLIGLRTSDVVLDLVAQLQKAKEALVKISHHYDKAIYFKDDSVTDIAVNALLELENN